MSQTQFAFLRKDRVPTAEQWQQAIDELCFDVRVQIDPSLKPLEDSGFLPCKWGDTDDDVGFEIYYESAKDIYGHDEEFAEIATLMNDLCICMRWGGRMKDCAAVMIASCALQRSFDAVISYERHSPDLLEKLIKNTVSVIAEANSGA